MGRKKKEVQQMQHMQVPETENGNQIMKGSRRSTYQVSQKTHTMIKHVAYLKGMTVKEFVEKTLWEAVTPSVKSYNESRKIVGASTLQDQYPDEFTSTKKKKERSSTKDQTSKVDIDDNTSNASQASEPSQTSEEVKVK